MGKDSASSAQSKHAVGGETARLGLSWGELGQAGSEQAAGGCWGVSTGIESVVGDVSGVYHMDDADTAHLQGVWGKLWGWGWGWGCSGGSGATVRGLEWS